MFEPGGGQHNIIKTGPGFPETVIDSRQMLGKSTYQAARTVAATIEAHFARHRTEAGRCGEINLAPAPDAATIEAIIDATFWASFRPEEGRFPKISLAFLPPEQAALPLVFDHTSVSACVTEQSHGGRTNPWMRAVTASTEGVERR